MMTRGNLKLALVCGAALSLSGCVAAAIPVLAGGAFVRTTTDGKDAGERPVPTPQPAAAKPAPAQASAADEAADEAARAAIETPAAAPVDEPVARPLPQAVPDPFAGFLSYAKSRAPVDPALSAGQADQTLSAVLSDPVALDGKRRACAQNTRAVLIDLDPGDAIYAPGMKLRADPELMLGLGELRANGITVAWVSGAPAAHAGDLRMALRSSGLDALSRDPILLMRYPDDRKQTRREEFAATTCLIAIAGDTRPDFDERFQYLRNPADAAGLDVLIGNGWFLVPGIADGESAPRPASPTP